MTLQTWYSHWFSSPFYHKLYSERDDKEAEDFITRLTGHLRPPLGARVLDAGCGRGRHSRFLAAAGYSVTGIDLSEENIAYAKQFENGQLEFFLHDMRLPLRGNYFRYVLNLFTSFGYFNTRREHDAAIRTLAQSLVPGGTLVIDYLNTHYAEDHLVRHETKTIGDTSYEIHRWDDETHFFKKITVTDPSLITPLVVTEKVVKFSLGDFTDMLSFQGLQVQEVFGDYSLGAYDTRKTPRLIIIAGKAVPENADKEKRLYSDGRTGDALT